MSEIYVDPSKLKIRVNRLEEAESQIRSIISILRDISNLNGMDFSEKQKMVSILKKCEEGLDKYTKSILNLKTSLNSIVEAYERTEKNILQNELNNKLVLENEGSIWSWISEKYDNYQKNTKEDEELTRKIKDVINSKYDYSKKKWKSATAKERKQIISDLTDELMPIYGIELSYLCISSDLKGDTLGQYDKDDKSICLSEELFESYFGYDEAINTLLHEMRHAYQYEVINHPENYEYTEGHVQKWQENYKPENYKKSDKDGYWEYSHQPIEKDARSFSNKIQKADGFY